MKYLSIIAAAVLFTLPADFAQAQVKSDLIDEHQYLDRSEAVSQYYPGNHYRSNSEFMGMGVAFDSDAAIGLTVFASELMFEWLMNTDLDNDVSKLKVGHSFLLTGDREFNFNFYGMLGYSSQNDDQGLLLEGGPLILLAAGESFHLAFGAGYNYDMAIEEEYFTFRGIFIM